jgi:hypothetical protein
MLYDNPQFASAVRKIISESLSTKPSVDSEQTQNNPDDERNNAPIATVSELRTQEPIRIKTEPEKSKAKRVWKWTVGILEVIGILAVIAYTILANKQWHEMISARHTAQDAIVSAKKSADESIAQVQSNFNTDQRPYLWLVQPVSPPIYQLGRIPEWHIAISNFGRSPAIQVHGCTKFIIVHQSLETHLSILQVLAKLKAPTPVCDETKSSLASAAVLPSGGTYYPLAEETTLRPVDIPSLAGFSTHDIWMVLYGATTYQDMSGKQYTSTFCVYSGRSGLPHYCPKWNDV